MKHSLSKNYLSWYFFLFKASFSCQIIWNSHCNSSTLNVLGSLTNHRIYYLYFHQLKCFWHLINETIQAGENIWHWSISMDIGTKFQRSLGRREEKDLYLIITKVMYQDKMYFLLIDFIVIESNWTEHCNFYFFTYSFIDDICNFWKMTVICFTTSCIKY